MSPTAELTSCQTAATEASRLARENCRKNIESIGPHQSWLVSEIPDVDMALEWVFGRDGFLTAMEPGEKWITGCSVPLLAARTMLKTLDSGSGVACFLNPSHAAQVRVALDTLNPGHGLICIVQDVCTLSVMFHCDDFSADLARGRLWFAAGDAWHEELGRILETAPGLPTPGRFIRLPHGDSGAIESMITAAQRVFVAQNTRRSAAIAELREHWNPNVDGTKRLCVIARSTFRLWDDAGEMLRGTLHAQNGTAVECNRFDPDEPAKSSPLELARSITNADAVVAADVSRADAPQVAPREMPWITWITEPKIPSIHSAGPNDRLILADGDWQSIARSEGWPDSQVCVGSWPSSNTQPNHDRGEYLALIADTIAIETPQSILDFSSQRLLWDDIRQQISRDPFAVPSNVQTWLHAKARTAGIATEALNSGLFISCLIVPAYQQALGETLINASLPIRLFGTGWQELALFTPHAGGAVSSREKLAAIVQASAAVIHPVPNRASHPIDSLNRPIIGRCASRENFIREARLALTAAPVSSSALRPAALSRELILQLLDRKP